MAEGDVLQLPTAKERDPYSSIPLFCSWLFQFCLYPCTGLMFVSSCCELLQFTMQFLDVFVSYYLLGE